MWSWEEATAEASSPEFKESLLVCDRVRNMLNLSPDLVRPFVFTADIIANIVLWSNKEELWDSAAHVSFKLIKPCQTLSEHRRQTLCPKSIQLTVYTLCFQ